MVAGIVDLILISALIILGAIASYQDIRRAKVKNKIILIGLSVGVLAYLSLGIESIFSRGTEVIYLNRVLVNLSLSCSIALLIWYAGLWSAGDAKTFMLFSFLLPLKYYGDKPTIPFFPSADLLVNSLILVLVFILIEMAFRTFRAGFNVIVNFKHSAGGLSKLSLLIKAGVSALWKNRFDYVKQGLVFICLFLVINIFRFHLPNILLGSLFSGTEGIIFIVAIAIFSPLTKTLRKQNINLVYLSLSLLLSYSLYLVVASGTAYLEFTYIMLRNFMFYAMTIGAIFWFIDIYTKKKEQIEIKIEDLAPYMLLSEDSLSEIDSLMKKAGLKEKFYADGLTRFQSYYIKKLCLKTGWPKQVSIYKTFPLTPFVFAGTLTIILKIGF